MEYLYETHMHTEEVSACARASGAKQAAVYKKMGYTGIIVTDHFINGYTTCPKNLPWEERMRFFASGYDEAKKAGDKLGLDVFFGWEFTIRGSDFLTYGLDLNFLIANPGLDRLEIDKYSELVRNSGGYLAQAHPYRDEYYIDHPYPVKPCYIDGVEVYNVMDRSESNSKALEFAEKNNLPKQAGTDAHGRGNKLYSGVSLKQKAESIHDIINAIKSGEATPLKRK